MCTSTSQFSHLCACVTSCPGSFDSMRTDIKANFQDEEYMGNALSNGPAGGFIEPDESINCELNTHATFVYDRYGGGMTET